MNSLELNKIYHGDCLDLMYRIPDKSIDMIFADLPFLTTNASWDCEISLPELWGSLRTNYKRQRSYFIKCSMSF